MSTAPMIEIEHLDKSYGSVRAVCDLSFRVARGEVVGFLGPNGAGKTTTLRILAGFLGASGGRVKVAGIEVARARRRAARAMGYMPETFPLYPELRVSEYLRFRAELKGIAGRRRGPELDRVLGLAGATDVRAVPCGELSKGYRQRVGLADALLGSPPVLILDEPTTGLDPNQIREVRALLRSLAGEHTILLSTHILSEVEASCDRVVVIAAGKLVADGPLARLRSEGRSAARLELVVSGARSRALALVRAVPGVARALATDEPTPGAARLRVEVDRALLGGEGDEPAGLLGERLARAVVAGGLGLRHLSVQASSLEQIFAELTAPEPP